jgi:outer membrane immunogenic protein
MKFTCKLAAAAALLGMAALPAAAADLPQRPVYKAPVIAPQFNWTGFYLGAYGGYAFGTGDTDGFNGGMAGGTIGYNWQGLGSPWVFGLEADGGWTNYGDSVSVSAGGVTATVSSEAKAMATFRARVGYAWDRTMLYATGGGAWMRNELSASVAAPGIAAGISDTQDHFGYAVGAGIEYAFLPNWSAKVEYLYLGLGSENYFGGAVRSGDLNTHTVKFGLNYRFGGSYGGYDGLR